MKNNVLSQNHSFKDRGQVLLLASLVSWQAIGVGNGKEIVCLKMRSWLESGYEIMVGWVVVK